MAMTFFYSPMSSATRVHWVLEELGVPYDKVKVDLSKGEQKKPEFLKLNPNGKIPLLVVDGVPIFESLAQMLYLGETHGEASGLFPKPGLERANAFKWMAWGSVSFYEALARIIKNGERVPEDERNPKARATALKEAADLLGILDAHLANRSYVVGDAFTIVDASLASFVPFSARLGVESSSLTNLHAWVARCTSRPALARVMQG